MFTYRKMKLSEKELLPEVDRSEHITEAYRQNGGDLELIDVEWVVPQWSSQEILGEWAIFLQDGRGLAEILVDYAREQGVASLYVTATPTKGTVEFYRSLGFLPTNQPLPELLELEPEDIHMQLEFPSASCSAA